MDDLRKEHGRLAQKANYDQAIDQVQAMIHQLTNAREAILNEPSQASFQLAKSMAPVKEAFDKANENLKQVNSALKGYEKALAKTFKTPFENPEKDALSSQSYLINRAIAMHLLREGQFDVASTFFHEVKEANAVDSNAGLRSPDPHGTASPETEWERKSDALQKQFAEMYTILDELRSKHNLDPAIRWAKTHSDLLESRGSNLEFELCRLRYVSLFLGYDANRDYDADVDMESNSHGRPYRILRAAAYARETFAQFGQRYTHDIHKLIGAMAYWQNVAESPYGSIFAPAAAWDEVCNSFTREFCSLLGLSSSSPLYIACTAGSMALPRLSKFKSLTKSKRAEWTTEGELPVEIPLPPSFRFHSIFVCPVSKEQGTDSNPPMMLPCGHVICKDSLKNVSKGARFKCPYCPLESHPREAKQVYL